MGNSQVRSIFREFIEPFEESRTLTLQNANQTDHWMFDYHNIPAFQFIQDPLDYFPAMHHTNSDLYEYVPSEVQKYNAEFVAYLCLQIANFDTLMPRKRFNFIKPNVDGNTTFNLKGFHDAKEVSVVGDFNNWDMFNLPMYKTEEGWQMKLELDKGRYLYKFIVDGYWTANPETPENLLRKDGIGHSGLTELIVN